MGRWHATELVRAGGTLIGVADPSSTRAERLAGGFGAIAYVTLGELLEHARPDLVHVCTPSRSHPEVIRQALEAGCHVLVEKPLAPDGSCTERLLDLARRLELILCPVHQYLFQEGLMRAQRALDGLGPLVTLELDACSAGGGSAAGPELGAVAGEILPHPLSVVQRLLSRGVDELDWAVVRSRPGELLGVATSAGVMASVRISMAGRPPRNELRVTCEGGTAHVDFFHGHSTLDRSGVSRSAKAMRPFRCSGSQLGAATVNLVRRGARRELAYPGLRSLIQRVLAAINSRQGSPVPPADTLAVARARDRLLTD